MNSVVRSVNTINRYGGGDASLQGGYTGYVHERVEGYDEYNSAMQVHEGWSRDSLEAARMQLVVRSKILEKTFGLPGPVYEQGEDGLQIKSFDLEFRGKNIARSVHGQIAEYGSDGTLKLDKAV